MGARGEVEQHGQRRAGYGDDVTAKIRTAVLSKLLATPARFPMNLGWAHHRMYLPKHEEQRAELAKEREEAERALRRTSEDDTS